MNGDAGWRRPALRLAGAALVMTAAVAWLTWPQGRYLSTHVVSHVDPFFSMWRVGWIAHVLPWEPTRLFDANIFHPARRTLAMSDATLLQGLIGAPLLWMELSPVLVYNLLLLGGMAGSGVGMFVLARHVTGAHGPAVFAGLIFALAPYRFEHIMHLELQWAMWIPLTLWAAHRTIETRSARFGVLTGLFLWLQCLSSVYYGVFLAMTLGVAVPAMLAGPGLLLRARALPALAVGAFVAVALTIPYSLPYRENAAALGDRSLSEVATYSARGISYLSAPHPNLWWGWTGRRWGGSELNLFPGLAALCFAIAALWHRPRRPLFVYLAIAIFAVELSLGTNGVIYPWLLDRFQFLHGLRAPARLGIVALCGIALLAALGMRVIQLQAGRTLGSVVLVLAMALALLEYRTTMMLGEVAPQPPERTSVYAAIRRLGPGVVLELPVPALDALPGFEAMYAFWSREHWNPILNGYSGYYPREFAELITNTYGFPAGRTTEFLRSRGVRYVVVHHVHLYGQDLAGLLDAMRASPALEHVGRFEAPSGPADLFLLTSSG